ncbi:MAG: protein adenylyltransferase SelO family protein, partial [Leucobacter sp.]
MSDTETDRETARTSAPFPNLGNAFARELPELSLPWQAAEFADPSLLVLNEPLAVDLGFDPDWLRSEHGIAFLLGAELAPGSTPVVQAYAGHQFGAYVPRLGDGRALLLGEVRDRAGTLHDLHLKGSGRTPFSRGADGYAAIGPMLRELLMGEAMHALGIPTTRALAVLATGRHVFREDALDPLPGAVLVRVAASHLRVGSFQYARSLEDPGVLERLTRFAVARHVDLPDGERGPVEVRPAGGASDRAGDAPMLRDGASSLRNNASSLRDDALRLLAHAVDVQARTVAAWMHVGFVHGVMNTDNTTISGETIDYGPCAFLDAYDAGAVFSSIDHQGRYAYGNQPGIVLWNLTRLAETLLPLLAGAGAGVD